MLKKTLISAAVLASMSTFAANEIGLKHSAAANGDVGATPSALDIGSTGTQRTYSVEGTASRTDLALPNMVILNSAATYTTGSKFTLDFDVALTAGITPVLFTSGTTASIDSVDEANGKVTVALLSGMTANTNSAIVIGGLKAPRAELMAKDDATVGSTKNLSANLSATAASTSQLYTQTLASDKIIDMKSQYALATTGVAQTITSTGKALTGANSDTVTVTLTDNGSTMLLPATLKSESYALNGDFSWVSDGAAQDVVAKSWGTTVTLTSTAATTADVDATAEGETFTINPAKNCTAATTACYAAAPSLPVGDFTVDATIVYTDAATGAAGATGADHTMTKNMLAGEWDYSGTTYTVRSVPTGSGVSNFIWAQNTGSAPLSLTMSITVDGKTYGPYAAGTVGKLGSLSLGSAIDAKMAELGIESGKRAAVSISASNTSSSFKVSAAYKVKSADDRLTLEVDN